MRNLVNSFKSIFRRKRDNEEEEEEAEEQQVEESASDDKFRMSCKRKKKKKPKEQSARSTKQRTEPRKTKTPPPQQPPVEQRPVQQSQRPQKKPSPVQKQSAANQSVKGPEKTKSTVMSTAERKKSAPSQKEATKSACVRMEANSTVPSSRYVNAPKSTNQRLAVSRSFDQESRASSDGETTSSFRRLKQFSARAMRKVKTFVSRPVKQATVIKVAKRVEERRKMEHKPANLTHGEDLFPRQKATTPKKAVKEKGVFLEKPTQAEQRSVVKVGTLPNGTVLVRNNDNNGELFMEKSGEYRPFWTVSRRPADEDLEESSLTDDDLQLNADVIFDVMNGKVKLVPMPNIPVVLDPLNEVTLMKERDKLFFNRDILFGNTVRTMINLSDQLSRKSPAKKRSTAAAAQMRFAAPNTYYAYKPGTWEGFEKKPFIAKQ